MMVHTGRASGVVALDLTSVPMLVSDTVTNGFEFSVTRERFRPAGTSADRDCSRSSPASLPNIPRPGRFHLRGPRPANQQDTAEGSVSQRHCPRTPLSSAVQVRSGLVWGFSCQAVVLGCAESFLFGAGKAVFRPVA